MTHDHAHGQGHADLLAELAAQLQPVFESSGQGIYIYFDDANKVCNEIFAAMLGYASAEEWAGMQGSFPPLFVDEQSHHALIDAYQKAMQSMDASTTAVKWKKKDGGTVDTTVILVPISYKQHLFALHFVE